MARLQFPASLAIRYGHVTEFLSTESEPLSLLLLKILVCLHHALFLMTWTQSVWFRCGWWGFSKGWLSSDWIPEWPRWVRLLTPFPNLDYSGMPRSPPSSLKYSFPKILGLLAAGSSHLNSSSGTALGERELLHMKFLSFPQGQPMFNN